MESLRRQTRKGSPAEEYQLPQDARFVRTGGFRKGKYAGYTVLGWLQSDIDEMDRDTFRSRIFSLWSCDEDNHDIAVAKIRDGKWHVSDSDYLIALNDVKEKYKLSLPKEEREYKQKRRDAICRLDREIKSADARIASLEKQRAAAEDRKKRRLIENVGALDGAELRKFALSDERMKNYNFEVERIEEELMKCRAACGVLKSLKDETGLTVSKRNVKRNGYESLIFSMILNGENPGEIDSYMRQCGFASYRSAYREIPEEIWEERTDF